VFRRVLCLTLFRTSFIRPSLSCPTSRSIFILSFCLLRCLLSGHLPLRFSSQNKVCSSKFLIVDTFPPYHTNNIRWEYKLLSFSFVGLTWTCFGGEHLNSVLFIKLSSVTWSQVKIMSLDDEDPQTHIWNQER
jgi:hypothetical protein